MDTNMETIKYYPNGADDQDAELVDVMLSDSEKFELEPTTERKDEDNIPY